MAEAKKDGDSPAQQTMEEKGVLLLGGQVNYENCNAISKLIIQANYEAKTDIIQLLIASPGGDVDAGFSLIDVMAWSKIPIYTTALGEACSMGFMILMSGEPGHRSCSRHTTLMSHRFWGVNAGNYSDLVAYRTQEDRYHRHIVEHYIRHTKLRNQKEVEKYLLKDVDNWISPEQAIKYGVIDKIVQPKQGFT